MIEVRRRDSGAADLSAPYWLRAWGKRIASWVYCENWSASQTDWMILNPDSLASEAMMECSLDYPTLIEEIRRCQQTMQEAGAAALDDLSDGNLQAYNSLQNTLAARISKACDLIEERTKAGESERLPCPEQTVFPHIPQNNENEGAHQAHREKLFPKGIPEDTDLVDAIVLLDSERSSDNTDIGILRKFTSETVEDFPKAKKLQTQIRKARQDGRTSLPKR